MAEGKTGKNRNKLEKDKLLKNDTKRLKVAECLMPITLT